MKCIRIPVLILCACFVSAAWGQQSAASGNPAWTEFHRRDMQRWNPYEHVLSVRNVGNLQVKWISPTGQQIRSSPAVVDGVVYVGMTYPPFNLTAVNASTGASLWTFSANYDIVSSPAVANGVVYFGSYDNNVYALNAKTGALLWSYTTGNWVQSSPAVWNGVIYIDSDDGNLYALNAETGVKLWSYPTGSPHGAGISPGDVAAADGVVYVAGLALNASTGALVWSNGIGGGLAVANGVVYVSSNDSVYAVNASTGATLWSYTSPGPIYSSPAVANGVVYVNSTYDDYVYALSTSTGALLWSSLIGPMFSSPAVANGVVYVGAGNTGSGPYGVYALNAKTGVVLWSYATINCIESSVTVVDGVVYAGDDAGDLFAFGLN